MRKFISKITFILGIACFVFIGCEKEDASSVLDINYQSSQGSASSGSYDCLSTQKNFRDTCRDLRGQRGFIDTNCICNTSGRTATYDCPRKRMNFRDTCRNMRGQRGFIDRNCDCNTSGRVAVSDSIRVND